MSYRIVLDSSGELPKEYANNPHFVHVALGLEVGDYQIMDDENFNRTEFLEKVAAYAKSPKSSCPSPEMYKEAYHCDEENIFVITLSSKLSGSYNSAMLGKSLYHEQYGDKNIQVIDSLSASCGETQIGLKAMELSEEGLPFEEIVTKLEEYRDEMKTYFVLDNLETLRKNGRLTGVKALVASTLSIKPVMGSIEGSIIQKSQAIGIKKSLTKMVDIIVSECKNAESKRLIIAQCNCEQRALAVKEMLLAKQKFGEILITETAGLSSMYANDGGIIVTV